MKQNKETLKSYFETGDKPTQEQYNDLIDSLNTPFIGEIKAVSYTSAPSGWAKCNGQLLNIEEYQDLFNAIGNIYGGDGVINFALPDLRGRTLVHTNNSDFILGESGGQKENILSVEQLPSHNHEIQNNLDVKISVNTESGESNNPSGGFLASKTDSYIDEASENSFLSGVQSSIDSTILNSGLNQPINNLQPYMSINYIIALEGRSPLLNL